MDQSWTSRRVTSPNIAKTATLELTPKQSEIVTLGGQDGDLSLVLRICRIARAGHDLVAGDENAPAERGDSYTQDAQGAA